MQIIYTSNEALQKVFQKCQPQGQPITLSEKRGLRNPVQPTITSETLDLRNLCQPTTLIEFKDLRTLGPRDTSSEARCLRNLGQAYFWSEARDFNPVIKFRDNFVTRNNFKFVKTIILTLKMTLFVNSTVIFSCSRWQVDQGLYSTAH